MSWLWRFFGRFPRVISGLILAGFVAGLWYVTDYVENVIKPREAEARLDRIHGEIARADAMFNREKYDIAITEYDYALTSFASELTPPEIARMHHQTAVSHVRLGEKQEEASHLEKGIAAFEQALALRSVSDDKAGHIETRHHMGDAWRTLAHMRSDPEPLQHAAAAYQAVLDLSGGDDGEGSAVRRAEALRAVANVQRDRFVIGGDEDALDAAFTLYDDALAAANPDKWPKVRGETLIELGLAWVQEAERGYRTRHLNKAVETLESAKRWLRVEAYPHEHALLHKHIGDTYMLLAQTKPRRRTERSSHQQHVIRWQNRAELAYKIARSFGFNPAQANLVPGRPSLVGQPEEEDKTEG